LELLGDFLSELLHDFQVGSLGDLGCHSGGYLADLLGLLPISHSLLLFFFMLLKDFLVLSDSVLGEVLVEDLVVELVGVFLGH